MADRLKIYACSGIGETDNKAFAYWTDGTNTVSNTQAVNTLLAKINLAWAQCTQMQISNEDKIALLNEIDWLSVALDAAKRFKGDNEKLYHAGEVISDMAKNGAFEGTSTDLREREERLEELIDKANELYSDYDVKSDNPEFMSWWKNTIVARNKVGLNFGQQQNSRKALKKAAEQIKGIGAADESWKENEDIAQYLTQAGTYFLYLYFTDEQLKKLPGIFKVKRQNQLRIYNYCKTYFVDVYGSEEDMQDIIRAGIIKDCKGEPEVVCADIAKTGNVSGVGLSEFLVWLGVKGLIALLTVAAGVLISIIAAICDCVYKSNVAKYASMEKAVVDSACPESSDYEDLDIGGNTGLSKGSSWFPIAAIAAGLLLLIKK